MFMHSVLYSEMVNYILNLIIESNKFAFELLDFTSMDLYLHCYVSTQVISGYIHIGCATTLLSKSNIIM